MRILIAPDSFKGSLSAPVAAQAMEEGVRRVFPNALCDLLPMADGGEGTVDALVSATGGQVHSLLVSDPLGRPVIAQWGLLGDGRSAVIEMAAASGLPLLMQGAVDRRDPLRADTQGTGELIREALNVLHAHFEKTDKGTEQEWSVRPRLIIGIGGSATNDGGTGMARALGARFLDNAGQELPPGGAALSRLARIDLSGMESLVAKTDILVACDVDNPLCGPRGAAAVFGPQKGATCAMIEELDAALAHFAGIAREATGHDVGDVPGSGAAGGLGAGLLFFTGAQLVPGVDLVLEATNFMERVHAADVVFTGEGRSDFQTAYGKAPVGVARTAKRFGKPVICVSGALGQDVEAVYDCGIDAVVGAVSAVTTLEECMEQAAPWLSTAVERVCRILGIGMRVC